MRIRLVLIAIKLTIKSFKNQGVYTVFKKDYQLFASTSEHIQNAW